MAVVTPLNNFLGPEGDTVTVDKQLLNTEYCRGPVTRKRVPDREEQGKPSKDARRGRCHPLEAGFWPLWMTPLPRNPSHKSQVTQASARAHKAIQPAGEMNVDHVGVHGSGFPGSPLSGTLLSYCASTVQLLFNQAGFATDRKNVTHSQ
jgi:hypothetical protein